MDEIRPKQIVSSAPPHLLFLDGLRGLTALYIVLYHCYFIEVTAPQAHTSFPAWKWLLFHWLGFGETAMPVFMVLTGFVLMRSALTSGGALRGGLAAFLRRRARRILPAYYAALALTLILYILVPAMNGMNTELFKGSQIPALSIKAIAVHFAMIEHLAYSWIFAIDPPAWGVAAIVWSNVAFALILLPLWRRIGGIATWLTVTLASLIPLIVLHRGCSACPWHAGLVVLGMMAAASMSSPSKPPPLQRIVWLGIATVALSGSLLLGFQFPILELQHSILMDFLTGIAVASFIVYRCMENRERPTASPSNGRILESKPLLWLGSIAYSLCLTHFPILWLIHLAVTAPLQADPLIKTGILLALSVPASLLVAAIFARYFERRFTNSNPHKSE